VDNLSFSYDGQTQVLNDIKMHAEKGEIIGIVGESGCGKSTFLKLLLRFWQKSGGSICYNGVDVDNINSDNLLDNVTMVSQSTYLFDETIEDNLRIAKPEASQKEIEEACKLASVHDFIMSLPEGYQTKTGALGDNLSAGEKQRIGLARAFLKGSELILLDEPTSNVDSINEGIILKALKEQKSKKSIILVSHRESTMAIADRIYRVENGKMQEVKN
jgi:ATP-binding cassette subfamily C protein